MNHVSSTRLLWKRIFCILPALAATLLFFAQDAAAQLQVPVSVQETAGIDRIDEPVSSGVPLPEGKVKEISDLTLVDKASGASIPCQFTVLARWPDKTIKWVLLDFFSSPKSGAKSEYSLNQVAASSPNNGSQPLQVKETDAGIEVSTGPLQFKISKKRGTVIDEAVLNGTTVISATDKCESMMTLGGGFPAGTIECVPSTVVVEQAGALRTVIRSDGKFLNAQKQPIWKGTVTYTCRVTAYAGKPYVKIDFMLQDSAPTTSAKSSTWLRTSSWGIRFPIAAEAATGDWEMSCAEGKYELAAGKPVTFNQWLKYSDIDLIGWPSAISPVETKREALLGLDKDEPDKSVAPLAVKGEGPYYLVRQGEAVKAMGMKGKGWAAISRGGKPLVTVVNKNFWENAPRGFSAEPGVLNFWILPAGSFWPRSAKAAKDETYVMDGARMKSATALVWFGPVAPGGDREYLRLDRPLLARTPLDWYAGSAGVWPLAKLAVRTADDRTNEAIKRYDRLQRAKVHKDAGDPAGPVLAGEDWMEDTWGKVSIPSLGEEIPGVMYGYMNFGDLPWGFGYSSLHYDMTYGMLMQHLRFDDPDMFYLGDQMAKHRSEIDHGYYGMQHYEKGYHGYNERINRADYNNGYNPNATHSWNRGLMLYWALTGDPHALSVGLDSGKKFKSVLSEVKGKTPTQEYRLYAWAIEGCLAIYEYTGDETYLTAAYEGFQNSLLKMETDNGSRGYIGKDGKQSTQFTAYCIEPLIRLHHYSKKQDVADFLRRVLDYHRKKGTNGGEMRKAKYQPLRFVSPGDNDEFDLMESSMAYHYQFADGFAYLYTVFHKEDDLTFARKIFQDLMFYYGVQERDVDPAFRTPLGYHYKGRVDNMLTKIHAFSTRYDQLYLLVEQEASDRK